MRIPSAASAAGRPASEQRAQERPGLHFDDWLRGRHQRAQHGRAGRVDRQRAQLAHPLEAQQFQCLGGRRTAQRELRDHQAPRLRQEQRALEPELAKLLADDARHVGHLGLAPQPRRGRRERGLVLPRRREIAQRPQALPLLTQLRRRLVPESAQRAQERPPGLAIHPQAERPGALAVEEQGHVRAPQLDGGDLRPHLQRLGDLGRDARQAERLLLCSFGHRSPVRHLAKPLRGLLAPRLPGGESAPQRRQAQLEPLLAEQIATHAQLGEQGPADRRRIVDDALEDARLHERSVQERTAGAEVPGPRD